MEVECGWQASRQDTMAEQQAGMASRQAGCQTGRQTHRVTHREKDRQAHQRRGVKGGGAVVGSPLQPAHVLGEAVCGHAEVQRGSLVEACDAQHDVLVLGLREGQDV